MLFLFWKRVLKRLVCNIGSVVVSGNLPTYPSSNLTFCPKKEPNVNVSLGEG